MMYVVGGLPAHALLAGGWVARVAEHGSNPKKQTHVIHVIQPRGPRNGAVDASFVRNSDT